MKYLKEDYDKKTMEEQFNESYEIMCKTNEPFQK